MRFFSFALLLILSSISSAFAASCPIQAPIIKEPKLSVYINPSCTINVIVMGDNNRKRSFAFTPEGTLMAVVDTDDYPGSISKGNLGRMFQILPFRPTSPKAQKLPSGGYEILTPAGAYITISPDGQLATINGGHVHLTPLQHIDKMQAINGGISFSSYHGIIIDHGMGRGGFRWNMDASADLKDGRGHVCTVKNSEMYSGIKSGDPISRFHSAEEWKNFVQSRCKNLLWEEPYKTELTKLPSAVSPSSADPIGDLIQSANPK